MFGLSGISTKLIIAGVVVTLVSAIGFTLWGHYTGLLDDNATLKANQKQLETALLLKDTEIASMEAQAISRGQLAASSREELKAARAKVDDLRLKLSKHDLGALIVSKPGLVTKAMQRGTRARFLSLEGAANAITE